MNPSTQKLEADPLTGLDTADTLFQDLSDRIGKTGDEGGEASLVLVDLDWFGRVNESVGSETGDRIIQDLARFLEDSAGESAQAYRFGGDALMLLFPGVTKEQAFLCIEQARRAFEEHAPGRDDLAKELSLTFSGGVASLPDDGATAEMLVRKCCEALYRAKLTGRNRICLARAEKMVTRTTHYRQGQLEGLSRLGKREEMNEASLLREALDDLLRKRNA